MKRILDKFLALAQENDVLAKSLCLLLAVFLWYWVYNLKSKEIRFRLPVKQINLPAESVVSYISPAFISIIIEGKEEELRNVKSQNIKTFVDLKKAKIGDLKRYRLKVERKLLPEGVRISTSPEYIKIKVEKVIEKTVLVKHAITGKVQDGAFIGKIRLIPDRVQIKGAKSLIEPIKVLYTEDISVDGKIGDIIQKVALEKDKIENITVSDKEVEAIISIINYDSLKKVTVPVVIRNREKNYTYAISNEKTDLYLKTNIKNITADDFEAYIEMRGFANYPQGEEKVTIRKKIEFMLKGKGKNAGIILIKPDYITIEIQKKK
jgi:hypothetical protein